MDELITIVTRGRDPGDYDPSCPRIDTAVKAIWLLYRRARWSLLAELGLSRKEVERVFSAFDDRYITTDHGRLHAESQVVALVKAHRLVLPAAVELVGRYLKEKHRARRAYYVRRASKGTAW